MYNDTINYILDSFKAKVIEALTEFSQMEVKPLHPSPVPPTQVDTNTLISLKEVQKVTKCSAPKLKALRRAKKFPPEIRIGRNIYFDRQQFAEFLASGGTR